MYWKKQRIGLYMLLIVVSLFLSCDYYIYTLRLPLKYKEHGEVEHFKRGFLNPVKCMVLKYVIQENLQSDFEIRAIKNDFLQKRILCEGHDGFERVVVLDRVTYLYLGIE